MKLYCHECNKLHQFTEGEAEQLVYILQAEVADDGHRVPPDDPYDLECLSRTLGIGLDAEVYAEHVEALTTRRRELVKAEAA